MQGKTGQSSVEFMLILIVMVFALTAFAVTSFQKTIEVKKYEYDVEMEKVASMAADRINTAFLEGDGFSMDFIMPSTIANKNYTLNIEVNHLLLRVENRYKLKPLLTKNVTGMPAPGLNTISNIGGEIIIT